MEIKYANSRIRNNFGHGILMFGLGLTIVFISETLSPFRYVWVLLGVLQIGTAWYYKNFPYLTIDDNKLTKHSLFPKSIEIDEIKKVWKMVNSYKIETSDKTLTIDKNLIEPESLYRLADYLNGLELKDFSLEERS